MELCDKYNAVPVIVDSHGIGVLGDSGCGVLEYFGIEDYKGICTASLGKALANSGGIVGGPKELIEYLSYSTPGLIYSTALTPASIGGLDAVLDILESGFRSLRDRLDSNKATILEALENSGFIMANFIMANTVTPIISLKTGAMRDTVALAKTFFEQGIIATPFVEPSVPPGKGVLRIIPGAGISAEDCEEVADTIRQIKK